MNNTHTRYTELDALRGIAATIVMLRHFVNVWPYESMGVLFYILLRSPIRIFFAAHEAVLLFYLLSGFVLTAALAKTNVDYWTFLFRRICRIYLPYLFALTLAVWGALTFYGSIPQLSDWFNLTWTTPVTAGQVIQHILFIGVYPNGELNTAFWTLIYEMRISVIFPIIFLITTKLSASRALLLAIVVSIAVWPFHSNPYEGGIMITFHYAAFFIVGSVMAKNADHLENFYAHSKKFKKLWILIFALALVTYGAGPNFVKAISGELTDWFIVAGLSWFMVIAISETSIKSRLNEAIPQFMGRISYSLYLIHGTILFALVHAFFGTINLVWLLVPYLFLSVAFAYFMYRHIEYPSMMLGKTFKFKRASLAD